MATAAVAVAMGRPTTPLFGRTRNRYTAINRLRVLGVSSLVSTASELRFGGSQFAGVKLSCVPLHPAIDPVVRPSTIVARRVFPFTGKKANRDNKVSFSNHKTKKLQLVNLQYKMVWWEAGKRYLKLRLSTKALKTIEKLCLSTKALKTIEKNGIDAVAKKAGIGLREE